MTRKVPHTPAQRAAVVATRRSPIRLAILECDEPIGRTKEKYGGYGNLFKELLEHGCEEVAKKDGVEEPKLDITKFNVVNHEIHPDLENVDAVLLTGSKYNSFDNDPWILKLVEFTRKVIANERVRLIGVCFGHQIIGRAMDVKVDRSDTGWEIAVCDVNLTDNGKKLFGLDKMAIHQMHRDKVYEYPPGVEHLGSSPACGVQGMYKKGEVLTVQGHPEFNGDIECELIEMRHNMGIFDDAMYKDGMERVRDHHDGVVVGAAFVRFLLTD